MKSKLKCIWTGNIDPRVKPVRLKTLDWASFPAEKTFYVLPEHEQKLRDINKRFVKHGRLFLKVIFGTVLLLTVVVLTALISSFSDSFILISLGIVTTFFGVVILFFPFTTPETVQWVGLKRSILFARSTGFIIILLGIVFSFLQLF